MQETVGGRETDFGSFRTRLTAKCSIGFCKRNATWLCTAQSGFCKVHHRRFCLNDD